jgi:hypothetical protein
MKNSRGSAICSSATANSMLPLSRIVALLMAAVLCFVLLVPMSLASHHAMLAVFVVVVYFAYLTANIVLWQRTRSRE